MSFIYCFTNLINQKKYIGSSCSSNPQRRYNQHMYWVNHPEGEKGQYPLYCAIRKYGIQNFSYTILEYFSNEINEEEIRKIEHKYLIQNNTLVPNGYNQTLDTKHPLNDIKTYEKIKETKRNKAKRIAEINEKQQVIQIWRSIVDCAEQTGYNEKHLASCCRGERKTTSEKKFCWIDDDDNLIIPKYHRDPYKGEKGTTQIQSSSRKVAKLDKNKNILQIYDTLALAARENNCDSSGISKVCRGLRNTCGGYYWKYVE